LAELAGVTLRGLTELEHGCANPTLNQLSKVMEVLGLEFRVVEKTTHAAG
jgi:DNA-binding phage protein